MKKILLMVAALVLISCTAYAGKEITIAEATGATTGTLFLVDGKVPASCHVSGTISTTALGEEITIQTRDTDNSSWQDIVEGGTTLILDSETTVYGIYAPGEYRFSKSATAAAAGLICIY